jgi:syntaxin-binding protein 1
MVPLLDNQSVISMDKLRLLLLYIISQEGIQDAERKRLLDTARISNEEAQALTNLSLLGVRLMADKKKKMNSVVNIFQYNYIVLLIIFI